MLEIKEASVCYSGGNIYITWGRLEKGNYFLGSLNDSITILNSNPYELIPGTQTIGMDDWEWCEKHTAWELTEKETDTLQINICEWILSHGSKECDNYSKEEIQALLDGLMESVSLAEEPEAETKSDREIINEALDAIDDWFREEREVDTSYGGQNTKAGYRLRNIRVLPEWITMDIYMLERSKNENDMPRGMDEASIRYDRKAKSISII